MSTQTQRLAVKARFFHGLSDPTRLAIVQALVGGERTVSDVVTQTGQSQPNVSNHLKCLLECGLVMSRREGKHVWYRLHDEDTAQLLTFADTVIERVSDNIQRCLKY